MKKIFKIFWVTQGCHETPLKMSKTPIFRGVSWDPWVAQNFDFNSLHTQIGFIKQILKRPAEFLILT
jgi:hypothetical protein